MIKVLQYGEGNFLRTFVDVYFDTLNKEGLGEYEVNIVKPITFGSLLRFEKQNNKYHIVLRGSEGGADVEKVYKVDSVAAAIDPFTNHDAYIALARDPELKIIVSNTTEAGITYNEADKIEGFDGITYPAKLTKLLYERFLAGLDGVYLLPVELIDNNADNLFACVDKYITLWKLPETFRKWNNECNYYCNTLVDRIVSGYPRDEETKAHLTELIGEADELVSVGEPFGLWAVEKKGDIDKYVVDGEHNIEVVLTNDIGYYKKRKVRVLNGSHTNLVPTALMHGAVTVYDCMKDERLSAFVENTLTSDINPFVSDNLAETEVFANSIKSRFLNPYLNHQLTSIALNSISKWRARDLPSFKDYYAAHGSLAPYLTVGFSYLMALYSLTEKRGDKYIAKLPTREIEMQDDLPYLEFFACGGKISDFMRDEAIFGEDLTKYEGFENAVTSNVEKIKKGESLI